MKKQPTTIQTKEPTADEQLKEIITEAMEWAKKSKKFFVVTLPSGVVVKLRKLRLLEYAMSGSLPLPMFSKCIKTAERLANVDSWENLEQDEISNLINMVRKIAVDVVVKPKVSENEEHDEDSVYVGDISEDDLFAIFQHAMGMIGGEPSGLESFPQK